MAKKKQRSVLFAESGEQREHVRNRFVIEGPDPVAQARDLIRTMNLPYALQGFTAAEKAAITSKPLLNLPTFEANAPKPVLKPGYLYLGDNGRCFCMAHAGMTALYTGRDLSGQKLYRLKKGEEEGLECEGCAAAADRQRKGNPTDSRDVDDARDLLTKTFGYPTGGNADWMNHAWFVQGSGEPNPRTGQVKTADDGLYALKSVWVVEQPEDAEYAVYLRTLGDDDAELDEIMIASAAEIQRVIDAARSYARDLFQRGARRGNPSSREYAGLSYGHLVSQYDARARRTGGMPWPRLNGLPITPAQIMIREIRETIRRMGPAATLHQAAHRVAENHPDVAFEAMDMIGVKGASEPELAALQSVWAERRRSNPTSKASKAKKPSKQKQFGSSVTPALQGLVRDVTGKACYQETCFVGRN